MDETKAPPAVTMSEASVLAQAKVGDNRDQNTDNADGDHSPEQMDQSVCDYRGKRNGCRRL